MEEFYDSELGKVIVKRNSRSKRLIARRYPDHVQLTVPLSYPISRIKSLLEELKPKLLNLKPRVKSFIDETTSLQTLSFELKIEKSGLQNFYTSLKGGTLNIICPLSVDFSDENVQLKLRSIIENAFRFEAKRLLPQKVATLAKQFGFNFSEVKINKSRTRWGSCSSKKSINLSYFIMLLPDHLVNFIILHELCHTIEMNHGERFWSLLDKVTGNKAQEMTKELKNARIDW